MTQDVSILYQGGSGGFALFYYLLLSNRFHTGLPSRNWQSMIDVQFNAKLKTEPTQWKVNEFWPDNMACQQSQSRPRLYLVCNPLWDKSIARQNIAIARNSYRIMLVTDFHTQLRMCWEKKAYWFTEVSRKKFHAPASTKQYLRQIIKSQSKGMDPMIDRIDKVFQPHQRVCLQDFLRSRQIANFDPPQAQQIDFLDRWIELQPPKVKKLLQ